jgi:hypothetical protein
MSIISRPDSKEKGNDMGATAIGYEPNRYQWKVRSA